MTTFDELAELWLKIKPSQEEPRQWIYAVDDAWFHPEAWTLQIREKEKGNLDECRPVFSDELRQKTQAIGDWIFENVELEDKSNGGHESPLTLAGPSMAPAVGDMHAFLRQSLAGSGRGAIDRDVVRILFRFILDREKEGLLYGLCFCSFEYFWKQIGEIDQPQNGVLFDIRHALGRDDSIVAKAATKLDLGDLRNAWQRHLEATNLFGQVNATMDRLGWYLHYCLKFAKVPGQKGPHSEIADNHIQIVSSAVNPGSGRSDAMSDYSQVQEFIWSKLSPLGGTPIEGIKPDRFTFSPMPKGQAMHAGLAIFNNSFKKAANWDSIRQWLADDIRVIYAKRADGHLETEDHVNLKWKTWLPNELKPVSDPLYITYENSRLILINSFLRMLSHSGARGFPCTWSGFDNVKVILPTYPGIVFVYLLVEFVYSLGPKDGRTPPTVTYSLEDARSGKRFVIRIALQHGGATKLWKCYQSGKKEDGSECGRATKLLWALGRKRKSLALKHTCAGVTLGDLVGGKVTFCKKSLIIKRDRNDISITLKAQ